MKLSPRQRQISVLKQRGASNKEIALVLGVEESTVKSQYKLMREKCLEYGVDIYAVPVDRVERMAFFQSLARVEYYKLKFGGDDVGDERGHNHAAENLAGY